MADYILAIDQGTTSTRAIIFDTKLKPLATAQKEFPQYFPQSGWVEHDPEEIWSSVLFTIRAVFRKSGLKPKDIKAIGITNQRETTLLWNRKTGKALHNAVVWQDRRTAALCATLKKQGHGPEFTQKTGLQLDPYFSGTKLAWLLTHVKTARKAALKGELCFGTIDSFLIWRLTGGKSHVTDATNASRTLLYNIHDGLWDEALCEILSIPPAILPEIKDCAAEFGSTDPQLFGTSIPICGVAGDQQAALIGQACFKPGMMKATYGTGCFALLNIGDKAIISENKLLTTVAYQLNGKRCYALEGAIFVAGAAVQWLRDGLKVIHEAHECDALAALADPSQQVYLIPAFVGLGVPHWNSEVRGAVFGLTRATSNKELAKAALESVGYQTYDLLEAMQNKGKYKKTILRVDGGMTASNWTMQFLADIINSPIDVAKTQETTALGAAYLAGLQSGILPPPAQFAKNWKRKKQFIPRLKKSVRQEKLQGWKKHLDAILA